VPMFESLKFCGFLTAILFATTGFLGAQVEAPRQSLLENSPFVPYSEAKPQPPPPPPPPPVQGNLSRELIFNGVLDIGGKTFFSVFDRSLNQSLLLQQGESQGARFEIVSFDAAGDRSINVKAGGRMERISLAASDGAPIPTSIPVSPPPAAREAEARLREATNTIRQTPNTAAKPNNTNQVPRRRIIPRRQAPSKNDN